MFGITVPVEIDGESRYVLGGRKISTAWHAWSQRMNFRQVGWRQLPTPRQCSSGVAFRRSADEVEYAPGPRDATPIGSLQKASCRWRHVARSELPPADLAEVHSLRPGVQAVLILRPPETYRLSPSISTGTVMPNIKLVDDGGHEQDVIAAYLLRRSSLEFSEQPLWQRLAEGHKGIDELLHVAIDEHDVAALLQRQRGFGLALELAKSPWRSDGEAANACNLSISPMISRSTPADKIRASLISTSEPAELRVSDANSRVHAEQQERRNDRASEHDLQLPQRSRLRSAGIARSAKTIAMTTQSRPTAVSGLGVSTEP